MRFRVHHHETVHHHFRGKPVGVAVGSEVAATVIAGQPCRHGMDAVGQDADVVFLLFGPGAGIGGWELRGCRNLLHMGIGSQGAADGHMQPLPDGTRHGETEREHAFRGLYWARPVLHVTHCKLGVGHIRYHLPCALRRGYLVAFIVILGKRHTQAELLRVGRGEPLAKVENGVGIRVHIEGYELHRAHRSPVGAVRASLHSQCTSLAGIAGLAVVVLDAAETDTYII